MSLPSLVISDLPGEAKNGCRVLGAGESPQILGDKFVFLFFLPQKLIKHDGGFIGFYEVSRKVSKIKGKFLAVEGETFWSLFNFTAMM